MFTIINASRTAQTALGRWGSAWLTGWTYRKSVTLSRASGAVNNYQMKLLVGESSGATGEDVDCGGHVLATFNDLRFTTSDGETLLDYWIESISGATPNCLATVWIEFDSIGTGATTFYMYYGKADAAAVSSGANTFLFFDDFPGVAIDTDKWDVTGSGITVGSSVAVLAATSGDKNQRLFSDSAWMVDNETKLRIKVKSLYLSTTGECDFSAMKADYGTFVAAEFSHRNGASVYWNYTSAVSNNKSNILGDAANTWCIIQLRRHALALWTLNDANEVSNSTSYPTDAMKVFLRSDYYTGNQTLSVDWVFVANNRATEPAWGAWGAEES